MKNIFNLKHFHHLYGGTAYVQSSTNSFTMDERQLGEKFGLEVRVLDPTNSLDLNIWMNLIHTSYDDCHFTETTACKLLTDNNYYQDVITFLFSICESGEYIGTVSVGRVRSAQHVGAEFKFAVSKKFQGRGYGKAVLIYAISRLASAGVKYWESAIVVNRKKSLQIHYSMGFRPQFNANNLACKNNLALFKNLNLIFRIRLYCSYLNFCRAQSRSIRHKI